MYTKETMLQHVIRLARYHKMSWWVQDEIYGPKNTPHFWYELNEFCWLVYNKAYTSSGPAYLGRIADIQDIRIKICNIQPSGLGLLEHNTKGNALSSPKWAPVLNDAWILGHIHRNADFMLVSLRSPANLWEESQYRRGVTITGRELIGLRHFGYVQDKNPTSEKFICTNRVLANSSDLIKYSEIMKREKINDITHFIGLNRALLDAIKKFDINKLRKVI